MVFLVVPSRAILAECQRFGRTYFPYLQPCFPVILTLKVTKFLLGIGNFYRFG
jgi:hypothetical protein